jgi:hypothetical protein
MFEMTSLVKIEGKKPFVPTSLKWRSSVVNYINTASVFVPAKCVYRGQKTFTGKVISEGSKIEIYAGYNRKNTLRFKGFVSRVNFSIPIEIECEGYSYQLPKGHDFTKSYKNTTVKSILSDLITGTDIVLSDDIPDIPIDKVEFIKTTGKDVLEWLKTKCLLTVYFINEVLYVGLQQVETTKEVKLSLGWNTADDKKLKFNDEHELADVRIELNARKKDGSKVKTSVGKTSSHTKTFKTFINNKAAQQKIAEQKRKELITEGYEGEVKAFLVPHANPGETIVITDKQYTERTGKYFCSSVVGQYSKSAGGKQTISVGHQV